MDWFKRAIMGNESSGPSDSLSDYSLSTSGGLSDFLAPFTGGGSGNAPSGEKGGSTSNIPIAVASSRGGGAQGGAKLPVSASAPSGGFTQLMGSRRGSRASTAQSTPMEAPEVDLSHLSEEERAQIAQVMARARELQDEDTKRIK